MHKERLPPNTHLEFNSVYFTYLPVPNRPTKLSNNNNNNTKMMSSPKSKLASNTTKEINKEELQEIRIGELATAKTPISPESLKSSSAWQHASMMLKKQQMNSTLKSSEERDQDLSASERSREAHQAHPAYGFDLARMGTASCWDSFQSIFVLPQGLAAIKASHAITLADPNNNSHNNRNSGSTLSGSKFSTGQIEQTSRRRRRSSRERSNTSLNTKLSGDL